MRGVQTKIGMATPSSRREGSIRPNATGPTLQRSRPRSQQGFSSSSMTPAPWAAYCKRRRYGDRSPASYPSIRSTTFADRSRRFSHTFERSFQLADYVQVKGASLENGLLHVDLVREIPEAMKPRAIPIASSSKLLEVKPTKVAA